MEVMYFISDFLRTAILVGISFYILDATMTPRFDQKLETIIKGSGIIALASLNTYNHSLNTGLFSNAMMIVLVLLLSFLAKIIYVKHYGQILCMLLMIWIGSTYVDFFLLACAWLVLDFLELDVSALVSISIARGMYLLVSTGFLAWGGHGIHKLLRRNHNVWQRIWQRCWGILVFASVALLYVIPYFQRIYKAELTTDYIRSWLLLIVGMIGGFLLLFLSYMSGKKREQEMLQEQQFQLLESNYRALQSVQDDKRHLMHDMTNHLLLLQKMSATGEKEQIQEYIENLYGILRKGQDCTYTNHEVMDLVLNIKLQAAEDEQIHVKVECDDFSRFNMQMMDVCSLFTNILDNAIEANQKEADASKRWIEIVCTYKDKMMIVHVSNPTTGYNLYRNGLIKTTKKDKKREHGNGLHIIQRIAKKYEGTCEYEVVNNVFHIYVIVNSLSN